MVINQLIRVMVLLSVVSLILFGCKTNEVGDEEQKREFTRRLQEAQELAKKIREGGLFNEEEIKRQRVEQPENVCSFSTNYIACDFGASPEFRGDGKVALYNDNNGIIFYYYIESKQRYKMFQFGQHASFGMYLPDGKQKYIFQEFEKVKTDDGLEQVIRGVLLNNENDWLKPAKRIFKGNALHPFLINEDKNVILQVNDQYFELDENLEKREITEQEYIQLRDSRFEMKHQWKVATEYKGIKGLWITDLSERNWNMIRDLVNLETARVIPSHYSVYCWGADFAGLLEIIPTDLPSFSIRLNDNMTADVGDLFDVFEKKVSPISQEVIGFYEDKYKGTLRVVRIVQGHLICEFQTKMYLSGVFKDDAAVSQKNKSIIGAIV